MERREFLQIAGASVVLGAGATANAQGGKQKPRPKGQMSVANMVAPILSTVRVGFIGVGARGSGHVESMCRIEGVEIKAICDIHTPSLEESIKGVVTNFGRPAPAAYGRDKDDYKRMLERTDLDIVLIATPWDVHAKMAIDVMNSGKHAFVEVPIATTVEECWNLVNTSERTQKHCMMMENVNYGREELMVLNMVQQGLFGELIHGEAAYIHDLRGQMHEVEHGTGSWRTYAYAQRNGNLYPTHGLGPVAHYMDVNRGDAFDYMVSVGSPALMRNEYAKANFPEDHKWRKMNFKCADINTSIIKTKRGRTIMVQWDEQLPRPYTRHNFLQGTKGAFGGFPNRIAIEGNGKDADSWIQGANLKEWYDKYDHPLWRRIGEIAKKNGGHGGMDFVMLWRIVYCLRNGLPLDQDVYDGVSWSVVTPLSETSVANRGRSMDFPDFMRGDWATRKAIYSSTNS
jgi:Oxidoreductase family, NAD-binding Rossmann fold